MLLFACFLPRRRAALALCRFFGLSDGYWLRAQVAYDIEVARRKLEPELKKIKPLSKVAAAL